MDRDYIRRVALKKEFAVYCIYQTGIFGRLHLRNRQTPLTLSTEPIGS
jgi:hypothetical protein